ncbi:MAG: aspartate aminotransferase family protein [Planctomycetes bacterium]|nr:aspartate aminotransferase family protein [Planctomycetota bacterium]
MSLQEWPAYTRVPLDVVSAHGSTLVLRDGRRVLDLYGGHCVNTLGAGDALLGEALAHQWSTWSFATNLLDHWPRRKFLSAFEKNLPEGSWTIFCSNSGAEANENALKAALAATGRRRVLCFGGAFHGRTAGAAALSDTKKQQFPSAPFDVLRVPWGDLAQAVKQIDAQTAAVILEPIQSLAGVTEPPPGFLEGLRVQCDRVGAHLIFDEVQTGNGRLGTPWASQYFGVIPDLFTTAKGAAGGLPIGLTVARSTIASAVPGTLFGSTFGGGPLVLAAAAEVARRVGAAGFLEQVRDTSAALRRASLNGPVASVRGAGLLLGLVLKNGFKGAEVRDTLLQQGVLVGTSDDPRVLRLSPSLTLRASEVAPLANALASFDTATAGAIQ